MPNCGMLYIFCQWTIITNFRRMNFKKLSRDLIGHPCSDQVEQVFQQAGIVFSIKIRQRALLPYWSIWVLQTTTL